MAIYVTIYKISDSDDSALYEFGPNKDRVGQIRIKKSNGDLEILSEVPGDDKMTYSLCAKRKLYKHWQNQEYPEKTCFAA